MRLFLFLLLFSITAHAQIDYGNSTTDCTEADLVDGGDIQCRNLTINGTPPDFWRSNVTIPAAPIDVRVNGDVIINGNLNLNGEDSPDGADVGAFEDFFGIAGPGGGEGGHTGAGGTPTAGDGVSGGGAGDNQLGGCAGGGGGGGFAVMAPNDGDDCGISNGGTKGQAFSNIFVDAFRGGFGGGSGGNGDDLFAGGGGGGGGAIRIRAKGNVTINFNITANGGAGGNSDPAAGTKDGGGGGGGSGGLIWIQALGNIENNANITANGGAGGLGNTIPAPANGSAGGRGAIRLEDLDGVITGSGTLPGYEDVVRISPIESFKSDIACGTIGKSEDHTNLFFQICLGFLLVGIFSKFIRKLKFFSES